MTATRISRVSRAFERIIILEEKLAELEREFRSLREVTR